MPRKIRDSKLVQNLKFRIDIEKAKYQELRKEVNQIRKKKNEQREVAVKEARRKKTRTPSAWSLELGQAYRAAAASGHPKTIFQLAKEHKGFTKVGANGKPLKPPKILNPRTGMGF